MISTRFVKLAVSGLALGLSLTGGHPLGTAPNATTPDSKQRQIAADAAAKATSALAAQDFRNAVRFAETAVEYAPRDGNFRMLLGQAYLGAGRFSSAETSFADVLTLTPDNGRAALNLALTEIAQGKPDKARATLADYREKLAVSDYGLAIGLAGDIDAAIATLETAIREGNTDAKTRQNLALSYAMAGRWSNARVMATQDLSGNDVNERLAQWATFVRPGSSYDQVATLLGVTPASDSGQPTRLALNGFADTQLAVAEPVPAPAAAPVPVAVAEPQPEAPRFETPVVAEAAPLPSGVVMASRREIVQPLPASYRGPVETAPLIKAVSVPLKQMIAPRQTARPDITAASAKPATSIRPIEAGRFVVQLGAFENTAVARDAWKRLSARFALGSYNPANSAARVSGANFVRLSVGGFVTRTEANNVCTRVRNTGGTCFVRAISGDVPAQWVQRGMPKAAKPVRIASR